MFTYKLSPTFDGLENSVIIRSDGLQIPQANDNTDYQEYLEWLAAGNEPEAADE